MYFDIKDFIYNNKSCHVIRSLEDAEDDERVCKDVVEYLKATPIKYDYLHDEIAKKSEYILLKQKIVCELEKGSDKDTIRRFERLLISFPLIKIENLIYAYNTCKYLSDEYFYEAVKINTDKRGTEKLELILNNGVEQKILAEKYSQRLTNCETKTIFSENNRPEIISYDISLFEGKTEIFPKIMYELYKLKFQKDKIIDLCYVIAEKALELRRKISPDKRGYKRFNEPHCLAAAIWLNCNTHSCPVSLVDYYKFGYHVIRETSEYDKRLDNSQILIKAIERVNNNFPEIAEHLENYASEFLEVSKESIKIKGEDAIFKPLPLVAALTYIISVNRSNHPLSQKKVAELFNISTKKVSDCVKIIKDLVKHS